MKQLKKIELATCDVAEMNPQELQNTNGGDLWDIVFNTLDYVLRDVSGGRDNGYTFLGGLFFPPYGLYHSISNMF